MARSRLTETQVFDTDFMSEAECKIKSTTTSGHLYDQMLSISGSLQVQIDDCSASGGDFSDGGEAGGADRTLGNTDNYDLGFLTDGTDRLHIDHTTGNVGIGETTPNASLHIHKSSLSNNTYITNDGEGTTNQAALWFAQDYNNNGSGKDWAGIGISNYGALSLTAGASLTSPDMLIDSSGNVGIGTTSSGAKLDVDGSISASGDNGVLYSSREDSTSKRSNLTFKRGSGNVLWLETEGDGSGNVTEFHLNFQGGERALSILDNGNVGIGDTSPTRILDVVDGRVYVDFESTSANEEAILRISNDTNQLFIGVADDNLSGGGPFFGTGFLDNAGVINTGANYELQFGTSNKASMTIDVSGNVGIGTTGPDGKLHIQESDASVGVPGASVQTLIVERNGNAGMSILSPAVNAGSIAFGDPDDLDIGMIQYLHADNSMRFTTNANPQVIIDNNGIVDFSEQSYAFVYLNSAQTVTTSTDEVLEFDVEVQDVRSEFNTTTHRFTATRAGMYTVTMSVLWQNPADGDEFRLRVVINGSATRARRNKNLSGNYCSQVYVVTIHLAASDYLECHVWQGSGGGENVVNGSNWTNMSIAKVH